MLLSVAAAAAPRHAAALPLCSTAGTARRAALSSSDAIPDKRSDANMVLRAEAEVFERSSFGSERVRSFFRVLLRTISVRLKRSSSGRCWAARAKRLLLLNIGDALGTSGQTLPKNYVST